MSEFNPFDSAVEETPAAADQTEDSAGSRKNVLLAGVLAAAALGAGAFFVLGGDDATTEEFTPVARAPRAAAAAASPVPVRKLPVTAKVTLGRNPFRALYVQPPPPPPAPPAAPAAVFLGAPGSQVPLTGGAPGVAAGGGTGSAPAGSQAGGPQEPTAQEHKLVLVRVFGTGKDQSASFTIDGKQQTAKVGSTFGLHAEILLLSLQEGPKDDQWTAVLQVGDSDPFDVVTGQPAYVR